MAQRTISDAGGDWTSTATWVEGAVPGTSDYVVATATSGDLTVSSGNKRILYIDLTLYTGTLTITSHLSAIELTADNVTSTFNAGAYVPTTSTVAQTYFFTLRNFGTHTISQVPGSPEIPALASNFGNTILLDTDIYVKKCLIGGVDVIKYNKLYISETFTNTTGVNYNIDFFYPSQFSSDSTEIIFTGTDIYIYPLSSSERPLFINNPITIDITGTLTIAQGVYVIGSYISDKFLVKKISGSVSGSMNLISGCNIDIENVDFSISVLKKTTTYAFDTNMNILTESSPTIAFGQYESLTSDTTNNVNLLGGTFSGSLFISSSSNNSYYMSPRLSLDPAYTHSIPTINGSGYLTNKPTLRSSVSDTQVNINLGSNTDSILANVNLTDIAVTGSTPLYAYQSTLDNTTGVTLVEPGGGGGGGESAYTYVN